MKKQIIIDETIGDDIEKKQFQSKRGAKTVGPKPVGAKRVLVDSVPKTNRPMNIYKEWVTDTDGDSSWVLWWVTEKSEYYGKEEIVRYNPRTEEELTQGYDYTVPFTVAKAKELIERSFGGTTFYRKDGETTHFVSRKDLDVLFLADVKVGLTPIQK